MFEQLQHLLEQLGRMDPADVNSRDWLSLLAVLLISALSSLTLSLLYALFFERRATGSDVHRAFPVLGVAITAIFLCLQKSLPMSLGLLGALSIVRFRTPIKEPEEIGFLMAMIATSICCATLNFAMLTLVLLLTLAALVALKAMPWFRRGRGAAACLVVTGPTQAADQTLQAVLAAAAGSDHRAALDGVTDCDGASTITLTLYRGTAKSMAQLHASVRETCPDCEVSLYLNNPRPVGE